MKNRIAFTSIGIDSYNEDGTVTDENISFVKARSQETALIISTVSMASYKYGKVKFIASYDDSFIPSLSRFAEAGHWGGAKMLLQISALGGPNTLADDVFHEIIPYVPSANIPDYTEQWKGKNVPRELSTQQVEEIADDFIKAAERAKKADFDGVELFAAEDFLLASFITPHFNCRNDRYGGSFENRLRLPVEIIRGIRKLCGEDFIIGFKYNAFYEFPEGDGVDLGLGVKIGQRIADEKVSYLHAYSYAKHDIPFSLFRYSIMASQYQPRNNTLPVAEALKKNIRNVAVMAVGSILKPAEADRIISRGYADLVSVGRAFIADHLWAYKARHGIPIRPCVRCFVCLDEATKSRIIGCSVNPDVLVEAGNILKEAVSPKKIMVTGSGPAGIVFSLTAKKRGHNVVLYEKEKSTGGKLITNAVRNLKYEYMDLLLYWRNELKKSGVEVITNKNATPELVRKNRPDVLVLAIGARNKIPSVPGINNGSVLNVSDAILKASNIKGKSVVIFGGQDYGCEAALLFARSGNRVTVVEEKDRLMTENDIEYLTMVLERLMVQEDIRFLLGSKVLKISKKTVTVENLRNKNTFEIIADIVVNASGFEVPEAELELLAAECTDHLIIGDCLKPAKIFQAVSEAFRLASSI